MQTTDEDIATLCVELQKWRETAGHIATIASGVITHHRPGPLFALLNKVCKEAMDAQDALQKKLHDRTAWERAVRDLSMAYGMILLALAECDRTLAGAESWVRAR